ncbi:MAG TPA: DUF6572 domain-containing protein [Thermoanaerobaculia bacterium]|jgi:hypothetical protein|nr:DUF6572 domain-containing protein [Thermoanaerobaculia bacterium]
MTVQQTGIVDWMGLERNTGHVILTIVDDLDWSDEQAHLLALQEKLNTYLSFAESGEVFQRLTQQVGRVVAPDTPIKMSVLTKYPLPLRAREFFQHATRVFREAGFELTSKVLSAPS